MPPTPDASPRKMSRDASVPPSFDASAPADATALETSPPDAEPVEASVDASPSADARTDVADATRLETDANDAHVGSDARDARDEKDANSAKDGPTDSAADVTKMHVACDDACHLGEQECGLLPQVCTYDDAGFTIGCQPQVQGVWTCVVGPSGCNVWGQATACHADLPCCASCEGGTCSIGGTGEPCQQDTDCASDACDAVTHACIDNQCDDHRQDGEESDVDCGGFLCDGCGNGRGCTSSFDCRAGAYCSPSHVCVGILVPDASTDAAPLCSGCTVGAQVCSLLPQVCSYDGAGFTVSCDAPGEGTWTCTAANGCTVWSPGIACGATCCAGCAEVAGTWTCPPLADQSPCDQDTDCVSSACDALSHECTADPCADHRRDGLETDVDCGGPACHPCGVAQRCATNRDCQPGHVCATNGFWSACH